MKAKAVYSKPKKDVLSPSPFCGACPINSQVKQQKRQEIQAQKHAYPIISWDRIP